MDNDYVSRVPWGLEPSLKDKTNEVGINFDEFIAGLKEGKSNFEMAQEFKVSEKLISHLKNHFTQFGVHSIVGRD